MHVWQTWSVAGINFLQQHHKLCKLKSEIALLWQWYTPTHSNSTVSFFVFLLLSPTPHPWPTSNPRLIHSTIQFPELSSSLKLNYGSILTFLKPRHWLMCSVERCALHFGPHVSPSRGDNLCHPLRPLFKSRSSDSLFCFVCFRWFTQINDGVIIWWQIFFTTARLDVWLQAVWGKLSEVHGAHTAGLTPVWSLHFFRQYWAIHSVFLDMISSDPPTNPMTLIGQVVY